MQNAVRVRAIFLAYTSFLALCSILILIGIFLSPSEPGNAILFGLSFQRLILASGIFLSFLFFLLLFLKSLRNDPWTERVMRQWFDRGRFSRGTIWFAVISFGLGWIGCFLPDYRAGSLSSYWNRIQPVMIFLLCVSAASLFVFLVQRIQFSIDSIRGSSTFRLTSVLFVSSLLLLVFMLTTQYGLYAREDFWYGAGVPILTLQLVGAISAGVLFFLLTRNALSRRFDFAIVLVLFTLTAILWARQPLQKSFLFTEPEAPNQEFYPFADAAAYDAGSQFALIGQGIYIFNSPFNDRPLYLSLLIYLHSLFGQNYELLMAVQAAIFAILPGLIYLIGRSLNMRAAGFSSAVVATLRGINSIAASSMIDMANPKMILSDFPAAIGAALIVLCACEWLKKPGQKWQYAIWTGGAIGLSLMIRPHALAILLFLPVYAIFSYAQQWRSWFFACALIGFGVLAVTLPWELRNVARGGNMYNSIVTKIEDVIRTRYTPPSSDEGNFASVGKHLSPLTYKQTEILSSLYRDERWQEQVCNTMACFAPKHFLHNAITSILILPTSPFFDDMRHTVKGERSMWRSDWQGSFTASALFFFVLDIFFILLGVSVIWKAPGPPGMVPLVIFIIYIVTNSLARTSGGRYIVPTDWIIPLYFMAGVLFLLQVIASAFLEKPLSFFDVPSPDQTTTVHLQRPWLTAIVVFGLLFGTGLLIPFSEQLHAPRYSNVDVLKTLRDHEPQLAASGLSLRQIDAFLQNPGAEILIGRTLYPRSYKMGQGTVNFYFYPFTVMDFPRTGFFLAGPHGQDNILLAGGVPTYLPHAADALVVGCSGQDYVDALLVLVLEKNGTAYARSPRSELTCPLKQPVCQNNSTCQ